ncbi:MAG: protein kinase [Gemmatimonadales bacterium]
MTDITACLFAALSRSYEIERCVGEGGMATVYLAEDLKHDRKVAIKVLRPELAAVLGAERFVQEIKIAARLNHPHILPLFDSGTVWLDKALDDRDSLLVVTKSMPGEEWGVLKRDPRFNDLVKRIGLE